MADHIDDGFDEAYANSWLELSKSDYARVLFCDLSSYDEKFGVGCRFQITDNVHEDPCDYVGLYRVGWKHISEYIVFKLLSVIECEEDGKMLRCIFKGEDLPKLMDGFYQFLYVTRDNEVCGASTPFEVKTVKEESASDSEDIVADKTEDDFLVVRSTLFEKNRELESKLSELQGKIESLEMEKGTMLAKMDKVSEESKVLQQLKESNAAAIRSFTAQVQSLEASVDNHKITNERYESHIIDYQAKVTSHEKKVRKTEQELKKHEDINLHLREQLKLMEKHMEDQRSQLKGHHTDFTQQNCLLAQQLENTKAMLHAAEESKQLAVEELKKKSHSTQNNGSKYNALLVEKFALKLQLDDEKKLTGQMEKERKSLEEAIIELNKIVKDKELLLRKTMGDQKELHEKYDDLASHAKMEILELQEKYEQLSTQTKEQATEQELTQMNKIMILDLEDQVAQLRERVQEKDETINKMKDTINDLTSNCALWEDEVNDLKSHCEDLNKILAEKDDSSTKLKEECIKKEAVIEYLTEEKDRLLKAQTSMSEQLNEMGARLRMAAELYREQYLKIKKLKSLKSKVYKMKMDYNSENQAHCSASQRPGVASYRDLFTASNSDSDTGEHVQRASEEKGVKDTEVVPNVKWSNPSSLFPFTTPKSAPARQNLGPSPSQLFPRQESGSACSIPKDFEKTEAVLHEMIQQNLAKLCTHVSEPECDEKDDNAYTLPCPICETEIVITSDDTDPMVAHLEYGHNQQMCPVCGRMFDKTMPDNYFQFHVEDHYDCGKGDEKKMESR